MPNSLISAQTPVIAVAFRDKCSKVVVPYTAAAFWFLGPRICPSQTAVRTVFFQKHSRECRGEGQYQRGQPFYRLPKQMQRELCLHVGEQGGNACSCWHTLRCNALRSSQRSSLMWLQPSCSARRAVPGSPQQIRKTVHGPRSIPRHRGRQYRCRSCRLYCRAGQRFSREMQ